MNAKAIILMIIAFFMFVVLFPISQYQVVTSNTTGWNAALVTLFSTVLPIVAAIFLAIKFIPSGGNQ